MLCTSFCGQRAPNSLAEILRRGRDRLVLERGKHQDDLDRADAVFSNYGLPKAILRSNPSDVLAQFPVHISFVVDFGIWIGIMNDFSLIRVSITTIRSAWSCDCRAGLLLIVRRVSSIVVMMHRHRRFRILVIRPSVARIRRRSR